MKGDAEAAGAEGGGGAAVGAAGGAGGVGESPSRAGGGPGLARSRLTSLALLCVLHRGQKSTRRQQAEHNCHGGARGQGGGVKGKVGQAARAYRLAARGKPRAA